MTSNRQRILTVRLQAAKMELIEACHEALGAIGHTQHSNTAPLQSMVDVLSTEFKNPALRTLPEMRYFAHCYFEYKALRRHLEYVDSRMA